jgi:hypothetical protein
MPQGRGASPFAAAAGVTCVAAANGLPRWWSAQPAGHLRPQRLLPLPVRTSGTHPRHAPPVRCALGAATEAAAAATVAATVAAAAAAAALCIGPPLPAPASPPIGEKRPGCPAPPPSGAGVGGRCTRARREGARHVAPSGVRIHHPRGAARAPGPGRQRAQRGAAGAARTPCRLCARPPPRQARSYACPVLFKCPFPPPRARIWRFPKAPPKPVVRSAPPTARRKQRGRRCGPGSCGRRPGARAPPARARAPRAARRRRPCCRCGARRRPTTRHGVSRAGQVRQRGKGGGQGRPAASGMRAHAPGGGGRVRAP